MRLDSLFQLVEDRSLVLIKDRLQQDSGGRCFKGVVVSSKWSSMGCSCSGFRVDGTDPMMSSTDGGPSKPPFTWGNLLPSTLKHSETSVRHPACCFKN